VIWLSIISIKNQRPPPEAAGPFQGSSSAGAADFYGLDNKSSFSYPKGYYLYQWVLHLVVLMMKTIQSRRVLWIGIFAPSFKLVSNDEI
jgi:hypothetical protein